MSDTLDTVTLLRHMSDTPCGVSEKSTFPTRPNVPPQPPTCHGIKYVCVCVYIKKEEGLDGLWND